MTVFQLKQLASSSVHAAADAVGWNYDRAELIADGIIHAIGVLFGIIAATVLVVLAVVYADTTDIVGVSIYVAGLLSMLVLSATYNLWPVSGQMAAAALRPLRDLPPDRLDLHAVHPGAEGQRVRTGAARLRLVRGDIRHRA